MEQQSGRGRAGAAGVLAVVLLFMAPGSPAAAQGPGLRFVGGIGYHEGSPGESLVAALESSGWGDDRTGWGRSQEYPFHFGEGIDLIAWVGARYRFGLPLSVEVLLSNGPRGHAEGFNETEQQVLVVAYSSYLVMATGGIHLGPVRLEGGPVVSRMSWNATRNAQEIGSEKMAVVGTALGASGTVRLSDVLVSLRAGIRQYPEVDLRNAPRFPIRAGYDSFYVGLTVSPAAL